jgi:hypothetical protein
LIGVVGVGHGHVGGGDHHTAQDQQRRISEPCEGKTKATDGDRSGADDPSALDTIGKARGQQPRDRISESNNERILQAFGDGVPFSTNSVGTQLAKP